MDKSGLFKVFLYTLITLVSAILAFPDIIAAAEKTPVEHVFLISVGGLNSEAYNKMVLPNLRYLVIDGVISERTMAVRADTVEAAEASLLTGTMVNDHRHFTSNDRVEVESLLDVICKNGRSVLVVDGSGGRMQSFARGPQEYIKLPAAGGSKEVFNAAKRGFSQTRPFFSYIYIDDCRDALMKLDRKSYQDCLKNFDDQLGQFIKYIRDSGLYKNSAVVITSARSSSSSNMVPLIIRSPNCKLNSSIENCMVIDVAATICRLSGLELPANSRGIPIYQAMQIKDSEREAAMNNWIDELLKDRTANWSMNYRLEDDLNRSVHQMTAIKEEKQSIFDFAGEREKLIGSLRNRLNMERCVGGILAGVLLIGYAVEYYWLKRKFLLFK